MDDEIRVCAYCEAWIEDIPLASTVRVTVAFGFRLDAVLA